MVACSSASDRALDDVSSSERVRRSRVSRLERLRALAKRAEPWVYGLFATAVTLVFAQAFYGFMRVQTGGEWSAPLDDVFIHFNYARSIARGYPFEWSEGNGYSTGPSLLYPFVLSIGYWVGFRGPLLVVWGGMVACASMVGFLFGARRLFESLPGVSTYLAPLAIYSVGLLGWTIFSGMEIALFLALWALSLIAMMEAVAETDTRHRARRELLLGAAGALLVSTRAEGVASVGVLAIGAAVAGAPRSFGSRCATVFRAGAPAAATLAIEAIAHWRLAGDVGSSRVVPSLFVHVPFLTTREALGQYLASLGSLVTHAVEHPLADQAPYGLVLFAFALAPFASKRLRGAATLLWASALSWLALVALNEPRPRNEVHAMPALAWVLLLAALGAGLLLSPAFEWRRRARVQTSLWMVRAALALALIALFVQHQAPRMREEIWHFARASRNLRDRQTTVGRLLRRLEPAPRRVLVDDAGAITYAADLPALHLSALASRATLPFGQAALHGAGASLELFERLPPGERPDYFAMTATRADTFPSWLGSYIIGIPAPGEVDGAPSETVIYRASYRGFGTGQFPRTLREGEEIVDELDVGDLVSEREHEYEACPRSATRCLAGDGDCHLAACGLTEARILPDPVHPGWEMFDAGRSIPPRHAERFRLKRRPEASARLIVRTVGDREAKVDVLIDGEPSGSLEFSPGAWREASLALPTTKAEVAVELVSRTGWVHHHAWLVQPK